MTERPDSERERPRAWAWTPDEVGEEEGELDALAHDGASFAKKRLVMWALRWSLGLLLIALVTATYPELSWLWWAGGAVALASLALLMFSSWLLASRIDKARRRMDELEAARRQMDETEPPR